MNLNQAQLGSVGSINLGGYIPAAAQRRGLLDEVLASIATSAGGAVAQRGVEGLMTPDVGAQAVQQGVPLAGIVETAPGVYEDKASALQRWFNPRTAQDLQRGQQIKQEGQYQTNSLAQRATEAQDEKAYRADALNQAKALADRGYLLDEAANARAGEQLGLTREQMAYQRSQGELDRARQARLDEQAFANSKLESDFRVQQTRGAKAAADREETFVKSQQAPQRQKDLDMWLSANAPGNNEAANRISMFLPEYDVNDPKAREAAFSEAVAKSGFGAGGGTSAAPTPAVRDTRSGWERTQGLAGDLGNFMGEVGTSAVIGIPQLATRFFNPQAADNMVNAFVGVDNSQPFTQDELAARKAELIKRGMLPPTAKGAYSY